jgi:SpoIIAA-like
MLNVILNEIEGIAILEPVGELTANDFQKAAAMIDPYIEKAGKLNGLIIHVESFPWWDSFAAIETHFQFIKGHHKKISKLAFATDSPIGSIVELIANHFVNAKIKSFAYNELENAKTWIQDNGIEYEDRTKRNT